MAYQKEPTQENAFKVYQYILQVWYTGSGNICGTSYDMNSLSQKFKIPREMISTYMKDVVLNSRIWNKEKQEELITGLIGEEITWALEDRMEIVHQTNLLKQSQNGKYTPFVTAELNKALKLRLESSTSLQSIIRSLTTGSNQTNIFQQINNTQVNTQETNYVTIEDARNLIQESLKIEDKSQELRYIEQTYDTTDFPEIEATKLSGNQTPEVSCLNKIELNAITDNYKEAIQVSSKEHHELRREIEQRIDPDEEDPELEIYEEPTPDFQAIHFLN